MSSLFTYEGPPLKGVGTTILTCDGDHTDLFEPVPSISVEGVWYPDIHKAFMAAGWLRADRDLCPGCSGKKPTV